jgi:hypothetical protein
MNKPSILKSVSISEMLHMREMGLSNAEIADKVGCSYITVNRHIGRAPFVKPGRGRKKKENDTLGLPPVGDKLVPVMPHKSFAERLEESYGKYCKDHSLTNSLETAEKFTMIKGDIPPEPVVEIVEDNNSVSVPAEGKPCTLADLAREAHERKMAEMSAVGTEERTHIPELIAVFGTEAVTTWLKVSLYDMGIPDCRPMSRQKMLEMLKNMNAGGANV